MRVWAWRESDYEGVSANLGADGFGRDRGDSFTDVSKLKNHIMFMCQWHFNKSVQVKTKGTKHSSVKQI